MMTSSEILGFPIRYSDDHFYLLGKKYRLSPGSVRSLGLFLDLVASAAKAQDTNWLIHHRGTIRTLEQLRPVIALTRVIKRSDHDEVVRLAIWLRGRCGGSIGSRIVAAHSQSESSCIRRATARCLHRMHAWQYLTKMFEDSDENVRRLANQLPLSRSFKERLEDFTTRVQHRPVSHGPTKLLVSPDVTIERSNPPRPREFFRRLLLRIRRSVRLSRALP